ncbi:hypothetical protein M413DRAFT_24877 [Hebeloma cylindrosporum]|uniref:DUF6589 domain-containing protein n=1 Tax=Hebeloma cylindrosporum TaxID=76867 RepID=A0A0C3CA98_HEBCY|nr:hypothetical protein M413DRAFT_24877 [Hebeloma cylindrosporum h7]
MDNERSSDDFETDSQMYSSSPGPTETLEMDVDGFDMPSDINRIEGVEDRREFPVPTTPMGHQYAYPLFPLTPHPSFEGLSHNAPSYSFPLYAQLPWTPPLPSNCTHTNLDDPRSEIVALEALFASHLFDDVFDGSGQRAPRTRAAIKWPQPLANEDKLLVILRCIKSLGFDSLGDFFAVLFAREGGDLKYQKHRVVVASITSFLQCQSVDARAHPLAIVDAIFRHPYSQVFEHRKPVKPQFNLPRYALPPTIRMKPSAIQLYSNTTRNALLDWAMHRILERVDDEAQLLEPSLGLVWSPAMKRKLTWDVVLGWSMKEMEETVSTTAPIIFSILTTISVNKNTRKRIEPGVTPTNSDSENESSDARHSGSDKGFRRDPWLATTVSILALLYLRYRFAILFPTLIGIFLFTCNANRDIYAVLGRIGITIAYTSVLGCLQSLAADSSGKLLEWGKRTELSQPGFLVLFDNVNKMQRAWQSTIGNQDEVKSGTASTLVELEDIPPRALHAQPLLEAIRQKKRSALTVKMLQEDINWDHIEGIGAGTVLRVWIKHVPALGRFKQRTNALFTATHSKHCLRLRKSKVHPMRTTDIDEATTTGTASVLFNLIVGQLGISKNWLDRWIIFVCGDQLTIDRVRKIKRYTNKGNTPFQRHDWALPIIQLWHLKWNWQKCIFRLHWWDGVGKNVFGLHHDCDMLGRGKFNPQRCDFYPAHHILEDHFEALALDSLRIICEEKTKQIHPTNLRLLGILDLYFQVGGCLEECTFEGLLKMAEQVYKRYMCNEAYEAALGFCTPALNQDSSQTPSVPRVNSNSSQVSLPAEETTQNSRRRKSQASAVAARNFSQGDQALATTVNFMRVTFWYLEICAAIAEGDIGRVFEVLKLLRFSFWGAGATNYGNELLELACNFLLEYPDDLKTAVLNNYLVNSSGLPGNWYELDLLQEHFNFWIKRLFNSKSHDFDARHLSEAVSLNISGFSTLRDRFPGLFGSKKNRYHHTDAEKQNDINKLGDHFRRDRILSFTPKRSQAYVVNDEFGAGYSILAGGRLQTFLERTSRDGGILDDDHLESSNHPDTPANPISSSGGQTSIDAFIGHDPSQY